MPKIHTIRTGLVKVTLPRETRALYLHSLYAATRASLQPLLLAVKISTTSLLTFSPCARLFPPLRSQATIISSPAFNHFAAAGDPRLVGEWVDEVASRAAAQNEQYLEIMYTPNYMSAAPVIENVGPIHVQTDFARLRRQLLDAGLSKYLPAIRAGFDQG
jgi:hypothetical protein